MNTVKILSEKGEEVDAKVGDVIAAFCCTSSRVTVGKIERIKNGFQACGLKITPKPRKCIWLSEYNKS